MIANRAQPLSTRSGRRITAALALIALAVFAGGPLAAADEAAKILGNFRLSSDVFEFEDLVAFEVPRTGPGGRTAQMTVVVFTTVPIDREAVARTLGVYRNWYPPEPHLELSFLDNGTLHLLTFESEETHILCPGIFLDSEVVLRPEGPVGRVTVDEPIDDCGDEFDLIVLIDTPLIEPQLR